MFDRVFTLGRVIVAAFVLLAILFAAGWLTRDDPAGKPYLQIVGGGFIFNYRVADVFYGFTAVVQRPLPTGSIVEAAFEDPQGGAPHIVRQRIGGPEMTRFMMRSPAVGGVEADKPYHVAIRILDREGNNVLWTENRTFRSQLGDSVAPDAPLTVGPGYARRPVERTR